MSQVVKLCLLSHMVASCLSASRRVRFLSYVWSKQEPLLILFWFTLVNFQQCLDHMEVTYL